MRIVSVWEFSDKQLCRASVVCRFVHSVSSIKRIGLPWLKSDTAKSEDRNRVKLTPFLACVLIQRGVRVCIDGG